MPTDKKIAVVLNHLTQLLACSSCGTRLRFADVECPHCGADIDLILITWAKDLIALLETT
jgi:uncharacterized protein (UPF0212 family)